MNRRQVLIGAGGALALAGTGAGAYVLDQSAAMTAYGAAASAQRAALAAEPEAKDLIRFAALAANSHNTQPWLFALGANRIDIRPDPTRHLAVVDPDDHHLFVSLGGAAENLAIAAAARGRRGELRFDPTADLIAFDYAAGPPENSPLFDAIAERQSTRADYDGTPVAPGELEILAAAGQQSGVELMLITDRPRIEQVLEAVLAGNSAQMADAAFLRELKTWLRYSPRQALAAGDGLFSGASGSPSPPAWLGGLFFDLFVTASSENDKYARQIRSSAGLAVFVSEADDKEHWVRVGRASQRFALQATALGLKLAFVNQAVEVPAVRTQLAALLGVGGRRPDLVMRFGRGPSMPRSLRRSVEQIIVAA